MCKFVKLSCSDQWWVIPTDSDYCFTLTFIFFVLLFLLLNRCGKWTTYSTFPNMKANIWQLLADRLVQVTLYFPQITSTNVPITSAGKFLTDFLKVGRNMWKGDHFPCGQEHAVKKLRLSSMDIVSLERNIEEAARLRTAHEQKKQRNKTNSQENMSSHPRVLAAVEDVAVADLGVSQECWRVLYR